MDWNLDKKPQNKGINAGKLKKIIGKWSAFEFLKTKKISLNQILVRWFSEMQCDGVIPLGIPVRQSSQSSLDRHLPVLEQRVGLIGPGAKISANWWPRRVHR